MIMNKITQQQASLMYPIITEGRCYEVVNVIDNSNELFREASILEEEKELEYLDELRRFVNDNYEKSIQQIYNKLDSIHRTRMFDIEKVKLLPDDMIYEIKSYLEPELKYTRKFSILRSLNERFSGIDCVESFLFKVPKKLIIDIIKGCNIYHYDNISLVSSSSKENWCRMIFWETTKHFPKSGDLVRMDKNLEKQNREYSAPKNLDKWFKFFLYINTYKKYRALLESKLKSTDAKITTLKNSKLTYKNI